MNIDYPCYEAIIVDNGSSDGSWEYIIKTISEIKKRHDVPIKLLKLSKNYGFVGGNNAGYRIRNPGARYVALVNNDAIVLPDSLEALVNCIEKSPRVAACQGIVLRPDNRIDSAGGYLDELLRSVHAYAGQPPEVVRTAYYASYVHGAYSLFNVEALIAAGLGDRLFDPEYFAYYEDVTLSLMLWQSGYRVKVIPKITAIHIGGASFGPGSPWRSYLLLRNQAILNERSNTRFKKLNRIFLVLQALRIRVALLAAGIRVPRHLDPVKAVIDGIVTARRRKLAKIDVYRAPLLKLPATKLLASLLFRRVIESYVERLDVQGLFRAW